MGIELIDFITKPSIPWNITRNASKSHVSCVTLTNSNSGQIIQVKSENPRIFYT